MAIAFAERPPSAREVERLRLLLSTYQDGTGMLALKRAPTTLPGWRDFERAVAAAWDGEAQESKAVFDVLISDSVRRVSYGVSCKMRSTLTTAERVGHSTIEVSNSAGDFWAALARRGVYTHNYDQYPNEAGQAIIDEIERKYRSVSVQNGGTVDLDRSFYLVLEWDRRLRRYKLFQYSLQMPELGSLRWSKPGRRLVGHNTEGHMLLEWYGESGGQLKYYPFCASALWSSPVFGLEPLPQNNDEYGVKRKAAAYFPEKWTWANISS